MLRALTIHNIVLIERLTLEFAPGLNVLSGETGAGKSILLDSLGLALGERADMRLLREGSSEASVTASFELPASHAAQALLAQQDLPVETTLLLRRSLRADGGSRAFVNDQPVSISLLRQLGEQLVELHGQHDERGLLASAGHRALLDGYGNHDALLAAVARSFAALKAARAALAQAEADRETAARDADYLRHAVDELLRFAPLPGEEAQLAESRARMMRGEKIAVDLEQASDCLDGAQGAVAQLRSAARRLERIAQGDALLEAAVLALDRALDEAQDAGVAIEQTRAASRNDPAEQERIESRLFDLRALARKHKVNADDLALHAQTLARRLALIDEGEGAHARLQSDVAAVQLTYAQAASVLSAARAKAATAFDKAVMKEFAPLKLDKARFRTVLETLAGESEHGAESAAFEVATNPGSPFGPLMRIASGGELSRFMLAIKVVLASRSTPVTMIFDEIDRGAGGAVASAIGERLARLASTSQLLIITHAPQVAARADAHYRIEKSQRGSKTTTTVVTLDDSGRREEVARMLSGDTITEEARAQAQRLMAAE